MILTRYGKCVNCGASAKSSQEFITTIDMFAPDAKASITSEIVDEIREWRARAMWCEEHSLVKA